MAKMSLQEQFKLWNNRVEVGCKRMRDQKDEWAKYEGAYLNQMPDVNKDFKRIYYVNMPYVDMRSTVPKLYSNNPYIYIDPKDAESDIAAEIMEKVVNGRLDTWRLREVVREVLKSTKLKGRAYIKTSYKYEKKDEDDDLIGGEQNDEVCLKFVPRESLIIDPNALSFYCARWVAHEIHAPIGEIREKFGLKEDDMPEIREDKDLPERMDSEEKRDFQFGTYYEIENRDDHTLAIIVKGVNRFVVKPYKAKHKFHTMYDGLEWNDIPGKLDTKSDFFFWWDQLKELTEVTTQKAQHRRKLNSKYIIRGGKLDANQETDLTTYHDATCVQLNADQSIEPFQHAQLGSEVYATEQSTRQDITVISGINEMKQGLPQSQKTAREAMAIVAESQDVMTDRANAVDNFVGRIIEKCVWFIINNYDTTRVVDMTGMEQAEFLGFKERMGDKFKSVELMGNAKKPFMRFVGTDLKGKFKVKVKAGSSAPVNEQQRKQDLMEFMQAFGQIQELKANVDFKEFNKEVVKLLHLENKNLVVDPKSPYQENALLRRDIPVMPMMNEDHVAHIQSHEMENNNTPAFIAHLMGHKMMKAFLEKSQAFQPSPVSGGAQGPGGLSQDNIGGVANGSGFPAQAMPQQPEAMPEAGSPAIVQGAQMMPN